VRSEGKEEKRCIHLLVNMENVEGASEKPTGKEARIADSKALYSV
jgi:hypothetical protein